MTPEELDPSTLRFAGKPLKWDPENNTGSFEGDVGLLFWGTPDKPMWMAVYKRSVVHAVVKNEDPQEALHDLPYLLEAVRDQVDYILG